MATRYLLQRILVEELEKDAVRKKEELMKKEAGGVANAASSSSSAAASSSLSTVERARQMLKEWEEKHEEADGLTSRRASQGLCSAAVSQLLSFQFWSIGGL